MFDRRIPGAAIGSLGLANLTPGYLLSLLRSWLLNGTDQSGGLQLQDRSKCASPKRVSERQLGFHRECLENCVAVNEVLSTHEFR